MTTYLVAMIYSAGSKSAKKQKIGIILNTIVIALILYIFYKCMMYSAIDPDTKIDSDVKLILYGLVVFIGSLAFIAKCVYEIYKLAGTIKRNRLICLKSYPLDDYMVQGNEYIVHASLTGIVVGNKADEKCINDFIARKEDIDLINNKISRYAESTETRTLEV